MTDADAYLVEDEDLRNEILTREGLDPDHPHEVKIVQDTRWCDLCSDVCSAVIDWDLEIDGDFICGLGGWDTWEEAVAYYLEVSDA